jgi:hypothetical protein
MKPFASLLAPAILCVLLYCSCSKNSSSNDTEKPALLITTPQPNSTITLGADSLHFEITATDNEQLHEFTMKLSGTTGTAYFTESPLVHGKKFYSYHKHYNPSGITGTVALSLEVLVRDLAGNEEKQTVSFSVKQ